MSAPEVHTLLAISQLLHGDGEAIFNLINPPWPGQNLLSRLNRTL